MYEAHYRAIAVLATVLIDDVAAGQEIAAAAFAAMHGAWSRLRDAEKGLMYLIRAVVRLARSHQGMRRIPAARDPIQPSARFRSGRSTRLSADFRELPGRNGRQ